ncbi:hypothetical protein [Marinobacter sp. OP 3.4]|uniref:hypothetical protein n=1 Tax=Marinobacter sp. OP 3.4 TaxID=3076501 RepID=UPI002E203E91
MSHSQLGIARRNTAWLLVILYGSDVFWFLLSRSGLVTIRAYKIQPFSWVDFSIFLACVLVFCLASFLFTYVVRPLPKFVIGYLVARSLVVLAIILNILCFIIVDPQARYSGGEFTPLSWIIYQVAKGFTLALVVLIVRENYERNFVSSIWIFFLLASYSMTIDGLASALTLFVFIYLLLESKKLTLIRLFTLALCGLLLFSAGFYSKFDGIPDYVTPQFIAEWVVSRFSIQAEQMYTYSAGSSIVNSQYSYLELIQRDLEFRIGKALGQGANFEHPRNISEATRFDMHNRYEASAGSSAGALLGTAYLGPFFLIAPLFYSFIFIQYFYGLSKKVSFFGLIGYAFVFKVLHANFAGYLVIMSASFVSGSIFILMCLLMRKK